VKAPVALAISQPTTERSSDLLHWARRLAEADVPAMQIRVRDLTDRGLLDLVLRVKEIVRSVPGASTRILVNARADVALAAAIDGVHLPSRGIPIAAARGIVGPDSWIGRSTHSIDEAIAAAEEGADYVVLGPIFETPSKRALGEPLGTDLLEEATRTVRVPILAIGGIDGGLLQSIEETGAHGVAAIRMFESEDLAPIVSEVRDRFHDRDPGRDRR